MPPRRKNPVPEGLNGSKWRATHQATVDGVLARIGESRSVSSRGSNFFNQDSWTARTFAARLCEWARLNPASTPDRYDIEDWVNMANREARWHHDKGITIASTPDDLPKWLAFALVGGGYHEAWHTLYSRRTPIRIEEGSAGRQVHAHADEAENCCFYTASGDCGPFTLARSLAWDVSSPKNRSWRRLVKY